MENQGLGDVETEKKDVTGQGIKVNAIKALEGVLKMTVHAFTR